MTPEKRVQNAILKYLKELEKNGEPIMIERRQAGGFNYKMGIPDIFFVYNGTHVECEIKQPGGKLRPMQEKWRDRCIKNNIYYLCADSVEDVKYFIQSVFKKI